MEIRASRRDLVRRSQMTLEDESNHAGRKRPMLQHQTGNAFPVDYLAVPEPDQPVAAEFLSIGVEKVKPTVSDVVCSFCGLPR